MTEHNMHSLHKGERYIQKRRHTPIELTEQIPNYIYTDMPQQHADFYRELPYLPLAVLDEQGRPWASLLVTKSNSDSSVGIQVSLKNALNIVSPVNNFDPFIRALKQIDFASGNEDVYFAGVGIDFSNRRRNKIAGKIQSAEFDSASKLSLSLASNEHLGNCPKYITIRALEPYHRNAESSMDRFESCQSPLPLSCKNHINQASTVFLATKHMPNNKSEESERAKMGFNHRGGAPGFVRVYEEVDTASADGSVTTFLVLPDFSGNRFYQSLGNIQCNELVGLAFPNFSNGDMLYITGKAENLFDEDAQALMPRTSLVTRIRVTGAVFVKQSLNLQMVSDEQYSPYNPPVRYLRQELEEMGHSSEASTGLESEMTARLVSAKKLTESITTFTFQLSAAIETRFPGGFGIFDFSEVLDTGYNHMNEFNPQMVNEDYIRTWTLSSAPNFDYYTKQFVPVDQIDITVKRKPGGLVSNFLHDSGTSSIESDRDMEVKLKGTGVGFSCFYLETPESIPTIPPKMLWISGGVGITPFMSMWDGIVKMNEALLSGEHTQLSTDILLMFSGRGDDINVLRHFLSHTPSLPKAISISILIYQSPRTGDAQSETLFDSLQREFPQALLSIEKRRMQESDFKNINDLLEREIFLCGPDALMKHAQKCLTLLCGDNLKLHQESYLF
ncbi:hypothetical protein [Agarilytica rhodophyticola]|uniref:hypothetical protein n=1 Tax=Agarilytica rhodophyticola TaxID=1737490 RepID=UPI001C1F8AEE|nr:hypothetical protein [Agarilytica rhodophyticola]